MKDCNYIHACKNNNWQKQRKESILAARELCFRKVCIYKMSQLQGQRGHHAWKDDLMSSYLLCNCQW